MTGAVKSDAVDIAKGGADVTITAKTALDLATVSTVWDRVMAAKPSAGGALRFDFAAAPAAFDTAAATLICAAETAFGKPAEITGLEAESLALLTRVREAAKPAPAAPPAPYSDPIIVGLGDVWQGLLSALGFVGEVAVAAARAPAQHRQFKSRDMMSFADTAGVKAIPLVLLLGFLMGLILAFQSSIPLRRFGADIYVINLVALSLVRELGPLLAAIILSGRTGSAFAAELGTMVVNDEVAALRTMGVDPVTMLVLPRLAATMLVMPGLALILEAAGMIGMAAVMVMMGFPLVAIWNQSVLALRLGDLFGGLFKALWFGAAVAIIGCRTGLGAGQGPRAVGEAATSAVVGGIFATIVIDGIFTILYYRLGL